MATVVTSERLYLFLTGVSPQQVTNCSDSVHLGPVSWTPATAVLTQRYLMEVSGNLVDDL